MSTYGPEILVGRVSSPEQPSSAKSSKMNIYENAVFRDTMEESAWKISFFLYLCCIFAPRSGLGITCCIHGMWKRCLTNLESKRNYSQSTSVKNLALCFEVPCYITGARQSWKFGKRKSLISYQARNLSRSSRQSKSTLSIRGNSQKTRKFVHPPVSRAS